MSTESTTASAPPATLAVAITRQPIHDRLRHVVGYELLFRPNAPATDADADQATTNAILETFNGTGLATIAGERPAHVRVSSSFLLGLHAFALPAGRVVLVTAPPDPADEALVTVLARLAEQGYRISFTVDPRASEPPHLAAVADSVRLDVTGLSEPEIQAGARLLRSTGATPIATGVDSPALQQQCRAAGFDHFQGFFFCIPDVVHAQQLPTTGRVADLRTLAGLYAYDTTFEVFEQIITRDVGLSYRLLCYLNSAFFGLRREVSSVREALTLLGMRSVRRWATLMALSGTRDKPHELTVTALLRGRFCEAIGRAQGSINAGTEDALFTIGLFSVMDAILDVPLEQALEALPLTDVARAALLERRGPLGEILAAAVAYERGELAQAVQHAPGVPLGALYIAAMSWADAASDSMVRSTTDTSASTTSGAN